MITFNGVSSDDVGLIVEHYPKVVFPKRRVETFTIPGRSGDNLIDQEVYDNYDQSYEVFLDSKKYGGLEATIPRIASWLLSGTGYGRLEDSYFPEYFRMAYVPELSEFLSYFNEYGRGVLTFNCAPERWYKTGEIEIQLQNGQTLYNPSGFKAQPVLRCSNGGANVTITHIGESTAVWKYPSGILNVLGTGSGSTTPAYDIYNGSESYTFQLYGGYGMNYLDPRMRRCYRYQRSSSTSPYNIYDQSSNFTGDYDGIYLGKETKIEWDNDAIIYLTPRWWTI